MGRRTTHALEAGPKARAVLGSDSVTAVFTQALKIRWPRSAGT